jgi:RNA polymerase sigma-70 factor, ECF subfamily
VASVVLAPGPNDPAVGTPAGGEPDSAKAVTVPRTPPDEREVAAIWRLLRRLGVPDSDVDDATQEVFLVVAESRARIEPGKERSFAYGTALRVARAHHRAAPRSHDELDEDALPDFEAPGIEDLLDRREARRILDMLLEQMPFDFRVALVLFEIEELSISEIAQVLGIPRGTAASRVRRAREDYEARVSRLRMRMSRQGTKP